MLLYLNYLNRVIRNPRYVLSKNFLLHPMTSLESARRLIKNSKHILESAAYLVALVSDANLK